MCVCTLSTKLKTPRAKIYLGMMMNQKKEREREVQKDNFALNKKTFIDHKCLLL